MVRLWYILIFALISLPVCADVYVWTNSAGEGQCSSSLLDVGTNSYVTVSDCPDFPDPEILLPSAVRLGQLAPILADHPATNEVPYGGTFYRVTNDIDPAILELWYVRSEDDVATQLSAHDADGEPISRTRKLSTGEDLIISLKDLEERTADKRTLTALRTELVALRASLLALRSDWQATAPLDAGSTVNETKLLVNELRGMVGQLILTGNELRRIQIETIRGQDP